MVRMKDLSDEWKSRRKRATEETQKVIQSRWESGFSLFEFCIVWSIGIGNSIAGEVAAQIPPNEGQHTSVVPEALNDEWIRFLALASLHAKSCVIAEEVRVLLAAGLVEGAQARLRTMHECVVFASIIGEDRTGELAVRYHDSANVEGWRLLREIQNNHAALGWDKVDGKKMQEAARLHDLVTAKWGKRISEDYEWARPATLVSDRRLNFGDLERAATLGPRRALYKVYNTGIHVTATSVIEQFRLGYGMRYGPDVDADSTAFLAPNCLIMLSEVTCVLVERFSERLNLHEQLQFAAGLEFVCYMSPDMFARQNDTTGDSQSGGGRTEAGAGQLDPD
jgi:Family of unknown function (DUF5677)